MNVFGPRLRELREAAGLTQQQVCERAGITLDGLSKLERGLRLPGWELVCRLCEALNVSCEAFREPPTATPEPPRRGRPKKAAQSAQDATASDEAAGGSSTPEKQPTKAQRGTS